MLEILEKELEITHELTKKLNTFYEDGYIIEEEKKAFDDIIDKNKKKVEKHINHNNLYDPHNNLYDIVKELEKLEELFSLIPQIQHLTFEMYVEFLKNKVLFMLVYLEGMTYKNYDDILEKMDYDTLTELRKKYCLNKEDDYPFCLYLIDAKKRKQEELIQQRINECSSDVFIDFRGDSDCEDDCRGWNGIDRRCDCGGRRVDWDCDDDGVYVYPEAY